ncbi:RusA family crossover junction endodeoxyribonuclease [Cupriavidus alkaliphilus]|uniref:Holliday junction resolvase RusA-like endonuclease n=1 Tax=Cupriavidus alkaliphilus TaxID=942866 RepID=A0A7W4V7T2_9BURK|nr:RusA family crossover junction endodeoxyribonuclease [Cupriavidus alkaliphilus]MBB3006023.1 Holliday junction resolvase RusA-like endonuclease [Cupriavidus alkaliphilus]
MTQSLFEQPKPLLRRVAFTIPGQPVAKGRPKFARQGAFVRTYTPEKTASYENLVKLSATQAMSGRPPFDGPVELTLEIRLQIPASWSKKRQQLAEAGQVAATKKPDADNVLKAVKDGMNGIVWIDDAQAVEYRISKRYGTTPGVRVIVEQLPLQAA